MSFCELAADTLRRLGGKNPAPFTSAIIVCAGNSTRMGGNTSKQLLEVNGKPVLAHTLLAFENAKCIDEIVLVARAEDMPSIWTLVEQYGITKVREVTKGGDTRAASVRRGFRVIDAKSRFVAIHDGARCLITPKEVERVIRGGYRYGAAIAAKKSTDTVKIGNKDKYVESTPDRSTVWAAQTPQAFKKSLYEVALAKADKLDETVTDDAMLAENAGFHVKLMNCDCENIKITTPDDIVFAEYILEKRRRAQSEIR
jgi:2-C-methyl-D-erythritol 4-phosphate cytidylyltransferase